MFLRYDEAGLLSKLTFHFATPLLKFGSSNDVDLEHLPEVPTCARVSKVTVDMETIWKEEMIKRPKYGLPVALFRLCKPEFFKMLAMGLAYAFLNFAIPLCLPAFIKLAASDFSNQKEGWIMAAIICVAQFSMAIIIPQATFVIAILQTKLKASIAALVFQKAFHLSNDSWKKTSVGQVQNLLGQDMEMVARGCFMMFFATCIPLQTLIAFVGFTYYATYAVIVALPIFCACVYVVYKIGTQFIKYFLEKFQLADRRVKFLNEVVQSIRVVKYYAWEKAFIDFLMDIRLKESNVIKGTATQMAKVQVILNVAPSALLLILYIGYCMFASMQFNTVFMIAALVNAMRTSFLYLPMLYTQFTTVRGALGRIEALLRMEETSRLPPLEEVETTGAVRLLDATVRFTTDGSTVLEGATVEVRKGELAMVIGEVGSGKSALLAAMLKEAVVDGRVAVGGAVAFVTQEAWIFNATCRENILFYSDYNETRYKAVVNACCLEDDFKNFVNGDETEIGERGINISGGQKQRINLARAVYRDADIYFFDDTLSAVDVHVGHHIFTKCINGVLRNKTRVMVTNSLSYLKEANSIYVIKDSKVKKVSVGDEDLAELRKEQTKQEDAIHNVQHSNNPKIEGLARQESVDSNGVEDLSRLTSNDILAMASKDFAADTIDGGDEEEEPKKEVSGKLVTVEEREHGDVTWKTYKFYLTSIETVKHLLLFAAFCVLSNLSQFLGNLWIASWARSLQSGEAQSAKYISGYAIITVVGAACLILSQCMFRIIVPKSCRNIFRTSLSHTLKAPMSYFDTTPSGRIINRFTGDISEFDFQLPVFANNLLNISFTIISCAMAIVYASPIVSFCLLPVAFLQHRIGKFSKRSSVEFRRLVNISKSPLLSFFSESINGRSTIRAFRAEHQVLQKYHSVINVSSQAYLAERMAMEWQRTRTLISGAFTITFLALTCLLWKSENSSLIGMALTQCVALCTLLPTWVEMASQFDMSIGCVERLKQMTDLPQEESNDNPLPDEWPQNGNLQFQSVGMRYRQDTPQVLQDVTFSVKSGENVGIVGRSGCGKSSLLQCIYRVPEDACLHGSVVIAGLDTSTINRTTMRSHLAIIPQEPVLFSGSLRFNLDPLNLYSDEEVWEALKIANLKEWLYSMNDKELGDEAVKSNNRLLMKIEEKGRNVSVGQAQLICMARAALRRGRLLFMDEATASVDVKTDSFIQSTIRTQFRDCTVFIIAHRLHTITQCDRIVVMGKGRVVETGSPKELMQKENGVFAGMMNRVIISKLKKQHGD